MVRFHHTTGGGYRSVEGEARFHVPGTCTFELQARIQVKGIRPWTCQQTALSRTKKAPHLPSPKRPEEKIRGCHRRTERGLL